METPARVYYKYEGVSPAASHKPNTAILVGPALSARRPGPNGSRPSGRPSPALEESLGRKRISPITLSRAHTSATGGRVHELTAVPTLSTSELTKLSQTLERALASAAVNQLGRDIGQAQRLRTVTPLGCSSRWCRHSAAAMGRLRPGRRRHSDTSV